MSEVKYQVFWTEFARFDLEKIIEYISLDSIGAATNFYTQIKKRAQTLELFPLKGRIIPELQHIGVEKYRELIVSFWKIIYRVDNKNVFVLAVFDSRRDFKDLLLQRILQ